MRYRLMATYRGVPYHVGLGPGGNEATLFSPAPPPDELGFTPAGGHWRKHVLITDLDALWQSHLVGDYRGEPCLVLDDLGDRLHIAYLGRDSAGARQLGYWEIDREVFEVVVARQDIGSLTEERVDYPLASAMFPPSNREPAGQARTQAPGRGAGGPPPAVAGRAGPPRAVPHPGRQPASTPARMTAWHGSSAGKPWAEAEARAEAQPEARAEAQPEARAEAQPEARAEAQPEARAEAQPEAWAGPRAARRPDPRPEPAAGRRAGRRDRVPQSIFAELLTLAAIPHAAYAVDEEVPGAMCLVKADGGFEVFSRTDDARLDVRFFEDEEAAYFYLFGVLAAEAVRSGRLRPGTANGHINGSRGPGVPPVPRENVSKYLRGPKLPKPAPHPVIVN